MAHIDSIVLVEVLLGAPFHLWEFMDHEEVEYFRRRGHQDQKRHDEEYVKVRLCVEHRALKVEVYTSTAEELVSFGAALVDYGRPALH